jgi:hypothetical protein
VGDGGGKQECFYSCFAENAKQESAKLICWKGFRGGTNIALKLNKRYSFAWTTRIVGGHCPINLLANKKSANHSMLIL